MKMSLLAAVAVLALSAQAVRAEVLTYTGLPFASGELAGSSVDLTMVLPVPSNYTGVLIYSGDDGYDPIDFSISETAIGVVSGFDSNVYWAMDVNLLNGIPVDWYIYATHSGGYYADFVTAYDPNEEFLGIAAKGDFAVTYTEGDWSDGWPYAGAVGAWTVAAAPEPRTWVLMIMGLGVAGSILRFWPRAQSARA